LLAVIVSAMPLENRDLRSFSSTTPIYVGLLLLFGAMLRIVAANGELWLDEVWNIQAVLPLKHVFDVYLAPEGMDGHSSLFSCILFFFSDGLPNFAYRVPSVIFSILVLLVIYFNSDAPAPTRILTLLFFSTSYLFILYGIEARGYSGMILCLALAHTSFLRLVTRPARVGETLVFIISACFGFLFHYSFIIWFIGSGLAYVIAATLNQRLLSLQRLVGFGVPTVFIALMYLAIVRHLPPGSGPHPSYFHTFLNLMSATMGGIPLSSAWPASVLVVFAFTFLFLWITSKEITELSREEPSIAIYYLITILVGPVLFTLIIHPPIAMPRYYLTSAFAFTALFASYVHRTKAKIYPAIFLCCNLLLVMHLLWRHHGNYEAVFSRVVGSAPGKVVNLVVDHEFRHSMMLDHYAGYQIHMTERSMLKDINTSGDAPEWYLAHDLDWAASPAKEITLENKATYVLDMVAPSTPLSGWTLILYRMKADSH
jgi:hypothetical protein